MSLGTTLRQWREQARIPSARIPSAQGGRRRKTKRPRQAFVACFDTLEPRLMLSASNPTITISDASVVEGETQTQFVAEFVSQESGGLNGPRHLAFHDGSLYVSSRFTNEVLRYDAATGAFQEVAIPQSAGVETPWALAVGPDGGVFVLGSLSNNVVRYDPTTGISTEFISAAANGGLYSGQGLTFGPGGDLFITSGDPSPDVDEVLRFDGVTGAFKGVFVVDDGYDDGSNTLENPNGLVFGPDGKLYVANTRGDSIFRYNSDGTFEKTFVSAGVGGLNTPTALRFHDGKLYVGGQDSNAVHVYDGATGDFLTAITGGGLQNAAGIEFDANGDLYVSSGATNSVLRFTATSDAIFTVSLSAPSADSVTVNYTTANGTALGGSDFTATSGSITFLPGETIKVIRVAIVNDSSIEPQEAFSVLLSGAAGATLADGTGVGTIQDNDTKFYVVDDGSANRTYEYGGNGAAGENYALNSGNAAPRGAAATAAGDKVWVVDVNKKVFVYDAAGGLLGSWTAGSLPSNAQVEGIATNGNDIWIVDAKGDKVFKYTGAASRLSGSQNAASNFALNSGNKAPKDIVTDGVNLWVVNDSTANKVFKYTLAGSLVGSWTISGANTTPSGITLDPTGASNDLWIVDSGTDKVYQYAGGRSLTSGTHAASAVFNLAAGNTNPQGIADPPVDGEPVADPVEAFAPTSIDTAANRGLETARGQQAALNAWHARATAASPTAISVTANPADRIDLAAAVLRELGYQATGDTEAGGGKSTAAAAGAKPARHDRLALATALASGAGDLDVTWLDALLEERGAVGR